jgi:hypothetical protein
MSTGTDSSLPWEEPRWIGHTQVLLDSFRRWLGRELISRAGTPLEQSQRLFDAPFVVVSHGTQADPILNYGNATALSLWEVDLPTLLATPSRLTAEPAHRDERARLLDLTSRQGYCDEYSGIRISKSGRRFQIQNAIVWNLIDGAGERIGQAATFERWEFLETGS